MITLSWPSLAALIAGGGVLGAGVAAILCLCDQNHPDKPLPPLKE